MSGDTPRDKLLAAVVEAALAGGIADKSLRAIAAAAGTSHRMLIHHFGSREELLGEVIQVIVDRQRATFRELEASAEEVSGEIVVRVWDRFRSPDLAPQERLFFEIYGQALQGRQWAQPLLRAAVGNSAGMLTAMLEADGIAPEAARAVARLEIAAGHGLLLDVLATGDDEEVGAAVRHFADMLVAHVEALKPGSRAPGPPGAGKSAIDRDTSVEG
jgi:AcrR family transcriptional regulator